MLLEDFAKPGLDLLRNLRQVSLGDAYIFLVERFASDAGEKAGEFFTPRTVSEVVAKLAEPKIWRSDLRSGLPIGIAVAARRRGGAGRKLPALRSGIQRQHALVGAAQYAAAQAGRRAHRLVRHAELADADRKRPSDALRCGCRQSAIQSRQVVGKHGWRGPRPDPYKRFTPHMPPKSRGDYAFILHMLAITRPTVGRMAVIAPHGVLFRSGAEGKIREKLIRDNLLDAVVGLPTQLFPTTGIPVCIMVFDKAREAGGLRSHERNILFIDASRGFVPGEKQNRLTDENVDRIVQTYRSRAVIERYSHEATFEEIEANDFNLNIPRYVDTFEPEPEVDLQAVQDEIRDIENQLAATRKKMNVYLKELGIDV